MGYAHGLDAEFLCYENRPFTLTEAIALAWVHGVEVRPYPSTLPQISPIWRAMDSFGTSSARWLPYWSGSGAVAGDDSVKVSAYSQPGKALLFVSHLKRAPLTTTLTLDRRRLGLASGTLRAVDAITGASVALDGDTLPLSFDGMTYRLIEVRDKHFKASLNPGLSNKFPEPKRAAAAFAAGIGVAPRPSGNRSPYLHTGLCTKASSASADAWSAGARQRAGWSKRILQNSRFGRRRPG